MYYRYFSSIVLINPVFSDKSGSINVGELEGFGYTLFHPLTTQYT